MERRVVGEQTYPCGAEARRTEGGRREADVCVRPTEHQCLCRGAELTEGEGVRAVHRAATGSVTVTDAACARALVWDVNSEACCGSVCADPEMARYRRPSPSRSTVTAGSPPSVMTTVR